jgi:hypothetical protein
MLHKPDDSVQYTDEMKWDHIKKGLAKTIHSPRYATWFLIEYLEGLKGGGKPAAASGSSVNQKEVDDLKSRCEALETTISGLTNAVVKLENVIKKATKPKSSSAPSPAPSSAPGPAVDV